LILFVAVAFAPVDVPYTLESVAKALPARQWVLAKLPDGSLTATLHDHLNGTMQEAEGYQFDRGDLVRMKFAGSDSSRTLVREGEILADISSNRLGEQLVELRNQLALEIANYGVVATGEKRELIRRLQEEIRLAEENLKLQKKLYDRTRSLYEDDVIALMELEIAENAHEAAALQVSVAKEALRVADTGEKDETIILADSRIEAIKRQIAFLEDKEVRYRLAAPFSGTLRGESTVDGERLLLEDTSAFVLFIPIRLRDSRFVRPGQRIELLLADNETVYESEVLEVSAFVEIINREQAVTVKAVVRQGNLPAGALLRCTVRCGNVRILEFLKRSIQWR
jgi:multidrug efflux pump subunit AcrA (membrane-fusion protein)